MTGSRICIRLCALALGIGAGAAHAQLGIYGTVTGQRQGGVTCPTYAAPCAESGGKVLPYGGSYGVYYDFRDFGPARLGLDLRGETLVSNKRADSSAGGSDIGRHNGALLGVRASFNTRVPALHPFVEIAGGFDRNNDTGLYTLTTTTQSLATPPVTTSALTFNPSTYTNYTVFKGIAGLDVRLSPSIDFRAMELGLGEAFGSATNLQQVNQTIGAGGTVTSAATAQTSGPSTHGIVSIGVGLVIRFGANR